MGRNLWKQQWIRRACWVTLAFIVAVNFSVSTFGRGDAFLLSPFHLLDKTRALGLYAAHRMRRVGASELPSPRRALLRAAQRHDVPTRLAFAIAKAESDFIPYRISHTGAMGVMQLMPDTARSLGVRDPFHPEENADGGVRYLARLLKRYGGNMRRVAAAYNAGPGRVPRVGNYRVPGETRHYVDRVIRYARQF